MMGAHTPGPWFVAVYSSGEFKGHAVDVYADEGDDGETEVCIIPQWIGAVDEQDANARLIAAAPDLLDALKGLFLDDAAKHPDAFPEAFAAARDAIARAEGSE